MGLAFEGRFAAGDDLLDGDLRDLRIVAGAGGPLLYAATGQNGGISVWRCQPGGGLAELAGSAYFSVSGTGIGHFALAEMDGTAKLLLAGAGQGRLIGYALGPDGGLGRMGHDDLPGTGDMPAALAAVALPGGGGGAVYTVAAGSGTLAAWASDGAGGIVAAPRSGPASAFRLSGETVLESATVKGTAFLLAADSGGQAVHAWRIAPDGGLRPTDSLGAADGLGIATPTALQTVTAHGATWVVVAAAGSGSLSVLRLNADGRLIATDHLLDSRATRFAGVTALKVIEAEGHVFVLAGGADDGLSLLSLLPGGQLVHLQSLADAAGLGLDNVTAIEAVRTGTALQIFVTSGGAAGLSQFRLDLGDLGQVLRAGGGGPAAAAGPLTGTPEADLLLGQAGQPALSGRDGDDILVAGAAGGSLTGGPGADIFVLGPAAGALRITDFETGTDRLDLTRFPMLRNLDQLDLDPTAWGMRMIHGTTRIDIHSAAGTPLGIADLWPEGFDTPDRVAVPGRPAGLRADGGSGNDILAGTAWADSLRGLGGQDRLRGGGGRDRLSGGKDGDALAGGGGHDRLFGGDGRDILKGGAGHDRLFGGDARDRLLGQRGDDRLNGGGGADVFVFGPRHGDDRIADFTAGSDRIRLNLPGLDFAGLEIRNRDGDALIDTGAGTVTLTDIRAGSLTAEDFLFG